MANNIENMHFTSICNSRGCQMGWSIVSINEKGKIYTCSEGQNNKFFQIGDVNDYDEINTIKKIKKLHELRSKSIDKLCKNCSWKAFCQGGCPINAYFNVGNYLQKTDLCTLNKHLYRRLLEIRVKNPTDFLTLLGNKKYETRINPADTFNLYSR